MRSIQQVCSKDHSAHEVATWGGREFNPAKWHVAILEQLVWVVELDGRIEGYSHLRFLEKDGAPQAHIQGLYLTPKAIGKGYGLELAGIMLKEARLANANRIDLESTLTAHSFYEKLGFRDEGPQTTVEVAGTPIRCYRMAMNPNAEISL